MPARASCITRGSELGAVGCAVTIQRSLDGCRDRGELAGLNMRVGLHAGRPLLEDERLFGVCVNTAVRVCSAANPRQVLVSRSVIAQLEPTQFEFAPVGMRVLKGLSERVDLYECDWQTRSQLV